MPHRPSCAKQLRERASAEQWDQQQTVEAIYQCCGVSKLRAQRLARGWTLREAVNEYRLIAQDFPGAAKADEDQLRLWETDSRRRPRAQTIDLLCRLYRTNAGGLGMSGDYQDIPRADMRTAGPSTRQVVPQSAPHSTKVLRRPRTDAVFSSGNPIDQMVEEARRRIDRTLAQSTVSAAQLDLLDERVLWLRHAYIFTPPVPMLGTLLREMEEVQTLAAERQSAAVQTRLSEVTALLATLVADALMKLGNLRQAWAWYATARTAADDSGNTELRARTRAQAAMLPYYYGPLEAAVALAREARLLSRHRATATGAFAAAAEARALARQGDATGAERAMRTARADFERCEHGPADDAFAFPERRLLLYLSGAYTFLGRNREARRVQQQALTLYPDGSGIDPALLRLEEAICLAQDRSLTEACALAQETYLHVPEEHRTPIVSARARHVIDVLPPSMRSARAARQLGEILVIPATVV